MAQIEGEGTIHPIIYNNTVLNKRQIVRLRETIVKLHECAHQSGSIELSQDTINTIAVLNHYHQLLSQ